MTQKQINVPNSDLVIAVGIEGHNYRVFKGNLKEGEDDPINVPIVFQNGTIPEVGVNGLTNESLLLILIDRTKHLNSKFPCRENALAITKMQEALMWFEERTRDREGRGVEGKHET